MFSEFFSNLPLFVLQLPVVLLAFSIHESAHGYAAYKLGDPTARNLGRLTLNPLKHIDIIGFICMLFFRIGWAKPVPINARNFKNPKWGMAISAAAGPLSNLFLAMFFAVLLRLEMLIVDHLFVEEIISLYLGSAQVSMAIKMLSILAYILFLGVVLNISLAIFNLIPIPPFDGSRIFHVVLPSKWYFKIMRYEQYIMIALLILLWIMPNTWLTTATNEISFFILKIFGMPESSTAFSEFAVMFNYITQALSF